MEHVYEYLVFLAQTVTIVAAIIVVVGAVTAMGMRRHQGGSGHLDVRKLNDHFADLKASVQEAILPTAAVRRSRKLERKQEKKAAKMDAKAAKKGDTEAGRKRVYVIDFDGDMEASQVSFLRKEITAVLSSARQSDEVLIRLESPGGLVHGYGLAASQLDRIRRQGVPLVVAVDKVAASGGYLMAAVADRILAAPFAVLGSIGVVAQIPNVHRLLKRHDVDVEVLTAGKYKRTLTVLGENTEEGRQKFIEELEDVHRLFKSFVGTHRQQVDVDAVATGEIWYGEDAVSRKLVDEIATSDDYLATQIDDADIYAVRWVETKRPIERVLAQVESSIHRITARWVERISQWRGGL